MVRRPASARCASAASRSAMRWPTCALISPAASAREQIVRARRSSSRRLDVVEQRRPARVQRTSCCKIRQLEVRDGSRGLAEAHEHAARLQALSEPRHVSLPTESYTTSQRFAAGDLEDARGEVLGLIVDDMRIAVGGGDRRFCRRSPPCRWPWRRALSTTGPAAGPRRPRRRAPVRYGPALTA